MTTNSLCDFPLKPKSHYSDLYKPLYYNVIAKEPFTVKFCKTW